ncbi:MAG: RNA polymerase subunit sigma-24 [Bacteroidetes bacterium CG23_combo_of_CG06-09_8_20_14_all_32_9]|nr:MAG: RNA polymerase subunit sigma-24 [Bacteroidetes bacterium CG23_combo_of_CG06-09_8_20_14_all_32_9]
MLKLLKHTPETDEELIAQYHRTKDSQIVGRLFERYATFVFAVSVKYLRDKEKSRDITMQVFEKLIDGLLRFEVKYFKSWLYQITKNQCLMYLRSEKTQLKNINQFVNNEKPFMENGTVPHHDEENETEINLSKLPEAMNTLSDKQRTCIELFYLQDKSYVEVAEITGFTLNEVKSFIQNGKRNLKIYLTTTHA